MALSGLKSNLDQSDSEEEPEFLQYKIVILGDGTVGKTTICMSLNQAEFQTKYRQTIGLDFFVKRLELPNNVNIALQIWDIGGQSIGSKMLSTYIYGSDAVLLVYDITNYQSFIDLQQWISVVKTTFNGNLPYTALIGNKTDLFHMQAVKLDKHNGFSDKHGLYSYLLSAKTGDQVFNTFYRIGADLSGVVLTSNQVESAQKVIRAEIVAYQNNDPPPPVQQPQSQQPVKRQQKKRCEIF